MLLRLQLRRSKQPKWPTMQAARREQRQENKVAFRLFWRQNSDPKQHRRRLWTYSTFSSSDQATLQCFWEPFFLFVLFAFSLFVSENRRIFRSLLGLARGSFTRLSQNSNHRHCKSRNARNIPAYTSLFFLRDTLMLKYPSHTLLDL